MKKILKKLALPHLVRAEDGFVTVEWIALAAIASVAAIAVGTTLYTNVATTSGTIPANLCTNATTAAAGIPGAPAGAPCN
jgi:Flp pilus assembly pilin Flp